MRIVCIDVVIGIEFYRAAALARLCRALWAAMVARLTLDARLIGAAYERLAAALLRWLLVERLFGQSQNESHE
jgi:hypothetical protein